jgi:hypothetical protein
VPHGQCPSLSPYQCHPASIYTADRLPALPHPPSRHLAYISGQAKRQERLTQQTRHGVAAERVAENILEDLFTMVLDWSLADCNNQVGYADLLLTSLGVKYLIVEVKRPGALAWNRRAVEAALAQAHRYADEQHVRCIGVSDGVMLYAADIAHGGLQDRVLVSLDAPEPPARLWWLSVHGIYRPCEEPLHATTLHVATHDQEQPEQRTPPPDILLHPKYKLPAQCFAYVGHAGDPRTWKLPYGLVDGHIDSKRLPKAIQAILSNYRGARVTGIPEAAIPDVLVCLAHAATGLGKMPHQVGAPASIYQQLADVLEQLGRLEEVRRA